MKPIASQQATQALPRAAGRTRLPAIVCSVAFSASVLSACLPTDARVASAAKPQVTSTTPQPAPSQVAMQKVPAAAVTPVADPAPRPVSRGRITVVEPIKQRPKSGNTGGIVGGVVGAVVGNQVGGTAGTVAGGVGGALLGNKIERMNSETVVGYRIHVQMDNGRQRVFERSQLNGLDVGDRVRVDGGSLREI